MKRGFTLIELAIALTIIAIVIGIVITVFASLNSRQSLDTAAESVKSTLEHAQSLTLASSYDTPYGVHFDSNQVVLFRGNIYSANSSDNSTTTISNRVTMSTTINGGGSDIVFTRLTGGTTNYGTTTLSLVSSTTTQRQVIVSQTGVVQIQ